MSTINTSYSTGVSALQLLKPVSVLQSPISDTSEKSMIGSLANGSRPQLSPSIQNALFEINRVINTHSTESAHKAASVYQKNEQNVDAFGQLLGPKISIDELSSYQREKVTSTLGNANYVVQVTPPRMGDEEFQKMMLDYVKSNFSGISGFDEALANGTLKIQRGEDVPELGLGSVQFIAYKDDRSLGVTYFGNGNFNKELYNEIRFQGIHQSTGSLKGQEFYITWPDESLAGTVGYRT